MMLTAVPWRQHCGDWPTAHLKHAWLWSGSSSCSSNCPVLVPSQHLLVLVQRLNFPTMQLKCALIQFWIAVLSSSGRLARLDIHCCPRLPLIWFQPQHHRRNMLNACSAYVATWPRASGTEWQKTLNIAYFSEWTWSTFDNVNPVSGRWVFHFNS